MLFIKGATIQTFSFFNKEQHFSVKLFANAKFGHRTVSNFNNTKFERLPKVKLLKREISTFGLFFLLSILRFNLFQSD